MDASRPGGGPRVHRSPHPSGRQPVLGPRPHPVVGFGVTTVVTSNCGYALAPVLNEEARRYVTAAMSTVEQIPIASIETGVPFDWDDLASYAAGSTVSTY